MDSKAKKRKTPPHSSTTVGNINSIPSGSKILRPSDNNVTKVGTERTSSYHGMFYHLQLGMVILLRAFSLHCERKLSKFEITMENKDGGKFDDIVLYYENAMLSKGTVYIQAKHKDPVKELKPITKNELLNGPNTKGPFSIPAYFVSYLEHYPKRKDVDTLEASHKYILCTNAPLSDDVSIVLPLDQSTTDGIFPLFDRFGGKFYAINQANNNVQHELRKASLEVLGKTLASCIKNGYEINGDDCFIFVLFSDLIGSCVEKVSITQLGPWSLTTVKGPM